MCAATFDREALGHGAAYLALGSHVRLLTNSLFRCNLQSVAIAPAGPPGNLLAGIAALLLVRGTSGRQVGRRRLLVLTTCFSFYWEPGYVIHAMHGRDGDLYLVGRDLFGEPSLWWRLAGASAGVRTYLYTTRWASRSLSELWPDPAVARHVAAIAGVSATVAAGIAAATYSRPGFGDLRDANLEIGASSFPLPFIPTSNRPTGAAADGGSLPRNRIAITCAGVVYALFVATLGRGLHHAGS